MFADNAFNDLLEDIAKAEGFLILKRASLSGGSINEVILLSTTSGKKVLKVNKESNQPGIFLAEKRGLETLKNTGTFRVPEVLALGKLGEISYLLLEYLPEGSIGPFFWRQFAKQLTALHKVTSPAFGFSSTNYIGSCLQYNESRETAEDFYISQRLEPQIRLATDNGYSLGVLDRTFRNMGEAIPREAPALIHGDLWSGNYLVTQHGTPALIDPAVSFGPREMDLAMMKLFGGFPPEVFDIYSEIYPLPQGASERLGIWQLYYLLVHLNIFGNSYFSSVKEIINRYAD